MFGSSGFGLVNKCEGGLVCGLGGREGSCVGWWEGVREGSCVDW